jgi:transposase
MDMTMSSIIPNRVKVVTSVQRRRRWTPEQKLEIVKQTNEPGSSVSFVASQHGLTGAQLFQWRKAYLEGSLVAAICRWHSRPLRCSRRTYLILRI